MVSRMAGESARHDSHSDMIYFYCFYSTGSNVTLVFSPLAEPDKLNGSQSSGKLRRDLGSSCVTSLASSTGQREWS